MVSIYACIDLNKEKVSFILCKAHVVRIKETKSIQHIVDYMEMDSPNLNLLYFIPVIR